MSPTTLAARLLRRGASSSSYSPLRALTRHALHSSTGPAPLPRGCLPAATTSPASHWPAARRFLASQSPPSSLSSSSSKEVSADEKIVRVIDEEIECLEQTGESTANKVIDLPDDFPFKIIDNPGDNCITLIREFAGETIKCSVYTIFDSEENLDEDDDHDDDFKPSIEMVVKVQKSEGPILEFECNFNDDELAIENFRILNRDHNDPFVETENMYTGPPFSILDESLKKSLHRYLEVRGVKHSSLHDWLYEYMMQKDEKEYVIWLKGMKEFVGN